MPQKHLLFIWKLLNKAIPSSDVLQEHHLQANSLCHFGCSDADSIHHIFFSCHLVRAAWFGCFSMCPPSHLSHNDLLTWLKQLIISSKDDEILLKSIISFLNDIWRKRNQAAHGGHIPHPHDIVRDSQSIVAFSAIAFLEKNNTSVSQQASINPNFSQANQWNVLVKRWKLHRSSYCRILVCFEGSLLQTFTWKRSSIPGNIFALGCFRMTLNWIHHSGLPKERLSIWNVRKRSIDFHHWAPSVSHVIARDVASLLRPFQLLSIYLLTDEQSSFFPSHFHDIVRTM